MSYRIEGKDIVLDGFEKGIADSPYQGPADMRNIELLAIPGEASVGLATTPVTKPAVFNAVSFTAAASTDRFTVASTTGLYEDTAIVLNTNSATGITTGVVYYVRNIVGLTFQLSAAAVSSILDITVDGSGTFTTYQYASGSPVSYWIDTKGGLVGENSTFVVDSAGHVWAIFSEAVGSVPGNTLLFMGNIGGVAASGIPGVTGITVWNGYLLLLGTVTVGTDYARVGSLLTNAPASLWTYTWQNLDTQSTNSRINLIVSQEDGNLYWTSTDGLGSLIETPGSSFNPATPATYTLNNGAALQVPETDEATCLAELGTNILIGGRNGFIYVWNKIDPGFSNLLNIPEYFTWQIVATSQNAYIFAGVRGRIYITNGSGVDLYKKVPDYVTGLLNPFFQFEDANFARNQLYFALTARTSAGAISNTVAGLWAIDLDSDALRMLNKTSDTAYTGTMRMVAPRPPGNSGSPTSAIIGNNLQIGWYGASASVIDVSTAVPYTNYEAFMELEIIPVGTYLDPFTPTQIEWKTAVPIGLGGTQESVRISYRTNLGEAYTVLGTTTATGTAVVGSTTGSTTGYAGSDYYTASFENVQWLQLKVEMASNATTPTYNRVTEVRIRDWPSGKNSK
jgi:hypothetical protein